MYHPAPSPHVFVFHPVVGITRVPQAYMDAYEASGFRYATDAEIARWCDEHDQPRAPSAPVRPAPPRPRPSTGP